ncbi:hypothetical protein NPIL_516561 [Nephila pilipes]|uniref:Uncharacterized protein n=1 Tax=Nephila pilipes TaxID=299642 RepID=A0A8X6Q0M8_NEPPI|nr:hypothetical protein NPIL_516561 [Nephila pilipes]
MPGGCFNIEFKENAEFSEKLINNRTAYLHILPRVQLRVYALLVLSFHPYSLCLPRECRGAAACRRALSAARMALVPVCCWPAIKNAACSFAAYKV